VSLTTASKLLTLAAAVACGIALPYLVGTVLLGTATLALIYGLFAMSVNIMAGYGGLVSLGQAGIMASSAYGVAYVATHTDGGHGEQLVVGLLSGIAISALFGLMAMRTRGVYFLMVTLAQGMIVYGLANSLAPITGAENGLTGVYRPPWVTEDWKYYYLCLAVLLVCAGLMWVVARSPFGLALRGLRESESRLRMLGYNPTLHRFYGFVLSGFFAGIAGILFAYNNQFVSPSVAEFAVSAQAVLMIILGGIATLPGPLIGAFIIVLAQNWLSIHVDRWPTIEGIVFVVMVLFARDGLVGAVTKLWHRFAPGRATVGTPSALALRASSAGGRDGADARALPSEPRSDGAGT
jgi:branched-chain amino acid transport system permease protein